MKFIAGAAVGITIIVMLILVYRPANTVEENVVHVAFFPNLSHSIAIVGMEQGTFVDSIGNQTQIEVRLFDSGPQLIESLFANEVDIGYVGPGPAINGYLKSNGQALKIIAGAASGGASFVVVPNSINSTKDLSGKRLSAPQIGNTQDVSLRTFLSQNNLKPAEKGGSVSVLNAKNADIFTIFGKGDIDGAWVPEPWATRLVQQLGGKRLLYEEDLWPEKKFSSAVLIVRSEYLEKHPDVVQGWINAHVQTSLWINEHPNQTKQIFNDFLKKKTGKTLKQELLDEAFSNVEITFDPLESSIRTFAERANALGYYGREGYDIEGLFYPNLLETAKEFVS